MGETSRLAKRTGICKIAAMHAQVRLEVEVFGGVFWLERRYIGYFSPDRVESTLLFGYPDCDGYPGASLLRAAALNHDPQPRPHRMI